MRKTAPLSASLAIAMLLACVVVLIAVDSPAQAAFPGKNGKIAFDYWSTASGSSATDVWTVNPDGSNPTPLTASDRIMDHAPAWSPDGKKIAYARCNYMLPDDSYHIYVMNVDGSNKIRLPLPAGVRDAVDPAWSADGKKIAFRSLDCAIYIMRVDGSSTATRLKTPSLPGCDARPTWSPDGSQIAFSNYQDGWGDIYDMDASLDGDTHQPRQLTSDPLDDTYPDWSPDGTEIAFESNRYGRESGLDVFKIDVNTLRETRLTSSPASEGQPAWSPDGAQIAYVNNDWWLEAIYKMNADGSNPTPVFDPGVGGGQAEHPDWQPLLAPPPPELCTITGTTRNDELEGMPRSDVICGLGVTMVWQDSEPRTYCAEAPATTA